MMEHNMGLKYISTSIVAKDKWKAVAIPESYFLL